MLRQARRLGNDEKICQFYQPRDVRQVAGMDPEKLEALRPWLDDSDQRPCAADVIRHS